MQWIERVKEQQKHIKSIRSVERSKPCIDTNMRNHHSAHTMSIWIWAFAVCICFDTWKEELRRTDYIVCALTQLMFVHIVEICVDVGIEIGIVSSHVLSKRTVCIVHLQCCCYVEPRNHDTFSSFPVNIQFIFMVPVPPFLYHFTDECDARARPKETSKRWIQSKIRTQYTLALLPNWFIRIQFTGFHLFSLVIEYSK